MISASYDDDINHNYTVVNSSFNDRNIDLTIDAQSIDDDDDDDDIFVSSESNINNICGLPEFECIDTRFDYEPKTTENYEKNLQRNIKINCSKMRAHYESRIKYYDNKCKRLKRKKSSIELCIRKKDQELASHYASNKILEDKIKSLRREIKRTSSKIKSEYYFDRACWFYMLYIYFYRFFTGAVSYKSKKDEELKKFDALINDYASSMEREKERVAHYQYAYVSDTNPTVAWFARLFECCICTNSGVQKVKLNHCQHNEICLSCVTKVDKCPLCREKIVSYEYLDGQKFVYKLHEYIKPVRSDDDVDDDDTRFVF